MLLFLLFYHFAFFESNLGLVIQQPPSLILITIRKRYRHVPKGDFKGNQVFRMNINI